jgi:CHAT domain-containing protein/tetratricopeptide (TPR) repeat protein
MPRRAKFAFVRTAAFLSVCILLSPHFVVGQEKSTHGSNKPADLVAVDPRIRALLNDTVSSCAQSSFSNMVERLEQALKVADSEGLIRDRALVEANLASADLSQAKLELAFTIFQRALQDAIDSNNRVLEADILIALASQAQLKGNNQESVDLISKALSISEHEGSLYEKSHALGELGRMMLLQGKAAQGAASIDEALRIDELNGYKFEAIHLVYRAIYLGLDGKRDEAMDSSSQARAKALAIRDAYSFITAENAYAYGLIQKGRTDEAIRDMSLLRRGELGSFTQDAKDQVCVQSSLELPIFHLTVLEDMANLLGAANQKDRELEIWQEIYEYSRDHTVLAGEAEAAQKVANLDLQLKRTDDALTHYEIAADLYRKLGNEPLLAQVELSQSVLLTQTGRGKEAIPLEQDLASYASHHALRGPEFTAYGVLAEIYRPLGDQERARDALETALSLVRPGPFDEELDNRSVLEDYSMLADVYRALKIPTNELVAIDKAFVVAIHLKDEKEQQRIVGYLDQRLKDLGIRNLVAERQSEGKLVESLLYACILFTRDGPPKPGEDNSNSNRILTLPFQIAQTPDGAKALTEVLDEVDSFLGFSKLAILDALSRYYIFTGNDPRQAEKYALRSEEILNGATGNVSSLRAESACVLAIAYAGERKNSPAKAKLVECSKFANEANDNQSLVFAAGANVMVQSAFGDPLATKESIESLLGKVPDNPELHIELAMSLARSKLYDDAGSQLDSAVGTLTPQGDRKAAAGAYVRVASALNADESTKAHELQLHYLTAGQSIYRELNAQAEEATTLIAIGEYYLKISQAKDAVDNVEKALDLAQKTNRKDIAANALLDLGNAYQSQKDFAKARDFHQRAATSYHELKNPGLEALGLERVAADSAAMNESEQSLAIFLEAKAVAAGAPALSRYFALVSLGGFYREQGQFEQSLAAFREAVDMTKEAGDLEHCAYSHLAIAELDGLIGTGEDAVGETETALNLFQDIGDKPGQAAGWAELTIIYSDRTSSVRNFDKAQECYAKAEDLGYGKSLELDLMEIYLQTGKYGEAEKIAEAGVRTCPKDTNSDCLAHRLLSLSEAQRLNGEILAASSSLNEARPLVSKSQDFYLHGRLLYAEARQLASEHKLEEALAAYERLISLIETLKGKLDAKEQKSFSENYGFIYDELVSLLYSMSQDAPRDQLRFAAKALEYAEINKARQFAESWGRTFISQMRRSLPANVQETERSLFSKRDQILAELNTPAAGGSSDKKQKADATIELATLQKDVTVFLQDLRKKSPQYAAVAYPESIQVSTLPVRQGETFVEFKLTNDSTFVWIVQNRSGTTNELISFYRVPQTRAWFLDRISLLRSALNSGHPEAIDWKVSEEIFAALFPGEASATVIRSQAIVFIPDDVLFALPFELYSPKASKGDFVFVGKPSVYYPSAVSFRLGRTAAQQAGWQEAFLGLADPITSSEDDRYEALKATHDSFMRDSGRNGEGSDGPKDPAESNKLKARGFVFERLPGTAIEVRNIAGLFQQANDKVEVRVGIDATKDKLLDTDLSKFRFLHFATHGVLPVDTGLQEPALVLSTDGVAPAHMFLSMSEILDLKLHAESVVLSACNTGSGKISRAEGVMSLGRAFLAAGSSSVTVSLWQVSDESTAKLMEKYYKGVLAGKAKSVALSEAREALFSDGYKDPFFWAPFILIGE